MNRELLFDSPRKYTTLCTPKHTKKNPKKKKNRFSNKFQIYRLPLFEKQAKMFKDYTDLCPITVMAVNNLAYLTLLCSWPPLVYLCEGGNHEKRKQFLAPAP